MNADDLSSSARISLVPDVEKGEVLVDSRVQKFSAVKKGRYRGGLSDVVSVRSSDRVLLYLRKMYQVAYLNTQALRAKLLQ